MNNGNDRQNLLDEVLSEAAPADFREVMLGRTLRIARRRRQFRQLRRSVALLAILGLCGALFGEKIRPLEMVPSAPTSAIRAAGKNYKLVETRPLPVGDIVSTKSLAAADFVATAARIGVVQTTGGNYRVINDEQLLALVGKKPAILIRTGPHSEELVFVNPEDQKGIPAN